MAPFRPKVVTDEEISTMYIKTTVQESVLPEENIKKIKDKKSEFEKFGLFSASIA